MCIPDAQQSLLPPYQPLPAIYSGFSLNTLDIKTMADKSNSEDNKPKFMKNEDGTPMTQEQLRQKYGVDFTKEGRDGKLKYGPDDPTAMSNRVQFLAKADSQYYDPCAEASKMSLNCLERNNYKKAMCEEYFQIYRDCKKMWVSNKKQSGEIFETENITNPAGAATEGQEEWFPLVDQYLYILLLTWNVCVPYEAYMV